MQMNLFPGIFKQTKKPFSFLKRVYLPAYGVHMDFLAIVRTMGQDNQEGEWIDSHVQEIEKLLAEFQDVFPDKLPAAGLVHS